ncbi:hypothetical protein DSL64_21985 [Dyadobacter luteus]|jgi:uncharacterized protein (DUF1501 family)|uniref:DUF1501 domain-containing protein n=1 Tax=Dyadobacter luteus TaxID=2259619 RepID=A0A3D8Y5V7_9BACT|nr:DUF1501 domain-containing protein [Dyadobacter luteus]REA58058.1 hypothetical protein DSL64_21985 [Dyadobacter luteus]
MKTSRRVFLKSGGLALFGIGLAGSIPPFVARAVAAEQNKMPFNKRKTLICIFQRGAMDGLMAVTPFNDPFLKAARPNLMMSAAQSANGKSLIDLDGKFGLHPSMQAFEPLFREGRLGIVHGIGSPNTTRSHFDAQDYMESGTPFQKGTPSGWLNRALGLLQEDHLSPFAGVALTSAMPRSFYGDNPSVAISNLQDFSIQMRGNQAGTNMAAKSFEELYDKTASGLLQEAGRESFEAMKILKTADLKNYKPAEGVTYPGSALANALKQIAQLIKMNVGLEVAFAESNGWDTHFNQGTDNGVFARNVADLSNSISAFWNDLSAYQDDVMLMTMTEFGRTVRQNGTRGTDHGRASCNFILGNNVQGGKVYGRVDELSEDNLEDKRDLAVTTDFRSVFSEVATQHLHLKNSATLFPEWKQENIGLIKT